MKIISSWVDGGHLVLLFRGEDGSLKRRAIPARYDFFIKPGSRTGNIHGTVDGDWIRISSRRWDERRQKIADLTKRSILTFEGDVGPFRQLLSDDIQYGIAKPKRAYGDLETDSRASFVDARAGGARVLSWCLIGDDGKEHSAVLEADTPAAERALLRAFWSTASGYDCLLFWNGENFDAPVLQERSKLLGCLPAYVQRWLWLDHMLLFKRMNLNSAEGGAEKESLKLNDIAYALLGRGKHEFDSSKTWQAWAAGGQQRAELLKYNIEDVRLMRDIEAETGYIDLFEAIAETTLVLPDSRGLKPTTQVDGFMLRLARKRGLRMPTKDHDNIPPEYKFRGAYVMKPPQFKGIVKDVHVADYSALYPSILRSWNMSPETLDPNGTSKAPTTPARFRTDVEGMLPVAVTEMNRIRKQWRDLEATLPPGSPEAKDAARKSMGAKVASNSFYGVISSRYSRYYSVDVGEAITQTGAWLLRDVTIPAARAKGWHVGYGDTDSLFVSECSPEEFRSFVNWCNVELYPPLLKEHGAPANYISLEYEKQFSRLVMCAPKKYAGVYAHFKGQTPKPGDKSKVRGLELKRGDSGRLARALQEEVVEMIIAGGCDDPVQVLEIVKRHRHHVLHDPLPVGDVQLSKSLRGEVETYNGAEIPHVRVARMLKARGAECQSGTRIFYVVANGASSKFQNPSGKLVVIPADDYRPEPPGGPADADRFYLWERVVFPPTLRVLKAAFPEVDWSNLDSVRPKVGAGARKYIRREDRGQMALPGLGTTTLVTAPPTRG